MSQKELLDIRIILIKMCFRARIIWTVASIFLGLGDRTPKLCKTLAFTGLVHWIGCFQTWLILSITCRVVFLGFVFASTDSMSQSSLLS